MNSFARAFIRGQFARTFAAKAKGKVIEKPHPKGKRLKELQKKFSVDDGVPVYLKGGTKDKILYQITLGGLVVGLLMSVHVLFTLIRPDHKKD